MVNYVSKWRTVSWPTAVGIIALFVIGLAIYYFLMVRWTQNDLAVCKNGYAKAQTMADTLAIDSLEVAAKSKGRVHVPVYCRDTRLPSQ